MKTKFVLIFLFFINYIVLSQKNGEAIYKISNIDSVSKEKIIKVIPEINNYDKSYFETYETVLKFNDSISIFQNTNYNSNKEQQLIDNTYCNCIKKKYTDSEKKTVYTNSNKGFVIEENEFLIERNFSNAWQLYNETKVIDGYTCYKATTTEQRNVVITITAWYCPKLPYYYGPKGYAGLPGLILELTDNFSTFTLKKLKLSSEKLSIELPTDGKRINHLEYGNIIKSRMEEVLKEHEKQIKQ